MAEGRVAHEPPPLPCGRGSQAYLEETRHKREDRLPLQGPRGVSATLGVQEEEEHPRPLRPLPRWTMERGLTQRQEALPRDPREGLPKQRRDLRSLHARLRRAEARGKPPSSVPRARKGSVVGLSPTSKNVAALFMRREEKLNDEQKEYLKRLCGADKPSPTCAV